MSSTHSTNRLAREKSPYLLQHAHNPVDWFAWGDEAFEMARRENKPIFLSVGYSTCHWCHVMERESFEDATVGQFLNEHFVSIKVDREERPDVDKIYMTFVQATTGGGGWPMNVFLTPDLKPFFGGTYFPPDNRHGRPSFLQVLRQVAELWRQKPTDVAASANDIHTQLESATANIDGSNLVLTADALRNAVLLFKRMYDPQHAGFGGAPKFPQPSVPSFLLRCAKRFRDDEAAHMILRTCERMAAGGIHDQLGGGFARYAVDAEWLVPHFEKMLYDNAQLAQLYLDAFLVSGDTSHADTARDILDYVLRDMTHPEGGFYSAEDADSEGHEGKFYCWTKDELSRLLSPEEFNAAVKFFGITAEGNFIDHSHPQPLRGQNVLNIAVPLERRTLVRREGGPTQSQRADSEIGATADEPLLASAKQKMLEARSKRIRPHRDDKILASWNGLMLGAFARAGAVLGEEKYLSAAEKNLKFIRAKLWNEADSSHPAFGHSLPAERGENSPKDSHVEPLNREIGAPSIARHEPERDSRRAMLGAPLRGEDRGEVRVGTLFHRWRDGERDAVELFAGYAFLLSGVIELYEATLATEYLDFAVQLAEAMLTKFYDAENGGFWQGPAAATDLILRVKDDYDGAEPGGNSVAVLSLLKLGAVTGRKEFTSAAEKTLRLFADRLDKFPQAMPFLLQALDFSLQEPKRVVLAGKGGSPKIRELLRAVHSVYQPNKVILGNTGAVEAFARSLPAKGEATVYLCAGNTCRPPTDDAEQVKELLQ